MNKYFWEDSLAFIGDRQTCRWYPNETLGKIFLINIGSNYVTVIDIQKMSIDGKFYLEKANEIIKMNDEGNTADFLCYKRAENTGPASVVTVDLRKAIKSLAPFASPAMQGGN
jgi:hypothetical protein